jgi:serine/threonine protein kinase
MAISPGTKLGPYEVQAPLGAWGMGEVYRAHDTRLGRDVAIKVLPVDCSSDPERLRRFEQEARATAALSHPNILAVFDVGQADERPYIVSELLQGETLRARLKAGPLPPRKAIEYAVQIARGLAAAHSHGILHRDLKPENIFVTRDGQIKILDFGLAKLTQPESSAVGGLSATVGVVTGRGELLGTLGYMSPEQVRGANVDARSDLFSFGAVLYEMVSGCRAFKGNTTADTITTILKEDPAELSATTPDVPPMLERIVRHCLEKDPAARFQSARDVAFDLDSLSTISTRAPISATASERWRSWLIPTLLGLTAVLLGLGGWFALRLATANRPAPTYLPLTFERESVNSARFTPDYHTVIYSSARVGGGGELFSVTPNALAPIDLGLKDTDIESISSSGEMLLVQQRRQLNAYSLVGVLARAPLTGGAPRPILSDVQDADWGPDNQVAVARFEGGRYQLEYPIGRVLYKTTGYISDVRVSPRGDLVAFADHPALGDNAGTVAVVDSSGQRRTLSPPQSGILGLAWEPSGKEVWFSGTNVGIRAELKATDLSGHTRVVASVPGSLVIHDIASNGSVLLRNENPRVLTMALGPGQDQERDLTIRDWTLLYGISADGRQAILGEEGTGSQAGYDVYTRPTDGSVPVHLGTGVGLDFSPDGKWVLAQLARQVPSPLVLIPLGPGEAKQITQDSINHTDDARFLPDGNTIVFTGAEPGCKPRIYTQAIGSNTARAISPEGVKGATPTADGKFVFGFSDGVSLYSVDGQSTPRKVLGIHPDERIAGVLSDGHTVLVEQVVHHTSLNIFRVDLVSGRRELFKKIEPTDLAGVYMFPSILFTSDAKYYAYGYSRILSQLYIVQGLR